MGGVVVQATTSLDGFIARPDGSVGGFTGAEQLLEDPEVVQGDRVTHLHYRVRKSAGR